MFFSQKRILSNVCSSKNRRNLRMVFLFFEEFVNGAFNQCYVHANTAYFEFLTVCNLRNLLFSFWTSIFKKSTDFTFTLPLIQAPFLFLNNLTLDEKRNSQALANTTFSTTFHQITEQKNPNSQSFCEQIFFGYTLFLVPVGLEFRS